MTAIAECAMSLFGLMTTDVILNTTIGSVRDLCIVQSICFFDLLLDQSECVHCRSPKERGELTPVPSVVCVLVIKTVRVRMIDPFN